jgi:hypothetical protein
MSIGLPSKVQSTRIATDSSSLNRIRNAVELLRGVTFDKNFFHTIVTNNSIFVTAKIPPTPGETIPYTFKCSLAGNIVTVQAGTFRLHGIGNYYVPLSTVTLTSATEWVFAWHSRDHSGSGISSQYVEPTSDTNTLRVPLAFYTMTGANSFVLTSVHHMGDISIDAPLR